MYQVVLCEDDPLFFESLKKVSYGILNNLNIEYRLICFKNSSDLLRSFMEKNQRYDLLLLDIIMDGMSGMEVAKKIRALDNKASIIFITSSRDYALEGYEVNALHYLLKPVDSNALKRLILSDYRKRFEKSFFIFETVSGKLRVNVEDILYFETVGRRVEVTLKDKTVYFQGKLTQLLTALPKGAFVRCHQSFVLNISNILELNKREVIIINGKRLPVSRTFAKDVQKFFLESIKQDV